MRERKDWRVRILETRIKIVLNGEGKGERERKLILLLLFNFAS